MAVDPVWYMGMMRKQRLREREEVYRKERGELFRFKSIAVITEMLSQEGVVIIEIQKVAHQRKENWLSSK